ncbi:hypothetical protein TRFO_42715 [Tritrichomonas foetus]|uniref:Nucleotide-diphospho-sugar transferase domain-containing protein n=1 Tax=Tritrichomonas foetus TaxID=1144522 RepID=A0A1J4KVZ8_9EUKA|nr:hypothetical protein TRFO_42715 [Tritrichomonas foetus]|eukprot:OHT15064.1 hypothetical protein TRFO_42715 [Tritrichomonas foetus]
MKSFMNHRFYMISQLVLIGLLLAITRKLNIVTRFFNSQLYIIHLFSHTKHSIHVSFNISPIILPDSPSFDFLPFLPKKPTNMPSHKTTHLINYTNNWYDELRTRIIQKKSYPNCTACKPPTSIVRKDIANSDETDFLIGVAFQTPYNLISFIGTYRAVGGKATVIVLCDHNSSKKIDAKTREIYKKCGGYIIDVGDLKFISVSHVFSTKMYLCYDFLRYTLHISSLRMNRVMIIDISDIVFQGDPFNKMVSSKNNVITFVGEHLPFKIDGYWTKRVKNIPHINLTYFYKKPVINGGTYAANRATLIKYFNLYFRYVDFANPKSIKSDDQAYINFLHYMNITKIAGFKSKLIEENEGYVMIYSTPGIIKKLSSYQYGNIRSPFSVNKTIIVHQFDRSIKITKSIVSSCPIPPGCNKQYYFRRTHLERP